MEENTVANNESSPKSNQMMVAGVVVLVLIAGAGLFLAANNKQNTPVETTSSPRTQSSPVNSAAGGVADASPSASGPINAGQARIITVEGGSFYYKPNQITVKKGEKIRIDLKSVDMMHDFVIDELNVKSPVIRSGNTGSVEFTANEVGEFEFYCSVGQHKQQGMVGKLVVTE